MTRHQALTSHPFTADPVNPLTPELLENLVPRPGAPRHNTVFNSFFSKFPSQHFVITGVNQRPVSRYFGLMGICNGRRFLIFDILVLCK